MGEDLHQELRVRLVRFARSRGLSLDDAEDLAGKAWINVWKWVEQTQPDPSDLYSYSYRALENSIIDWYKSPARILSKRLANVLADSKGPNPIVSWMIHGLEVVGLESQRGAKVEPATLDWIESNLSDFLYSERGLRGDSPSRFSTRYLITRLVTWCAAPVPRSTLVEFLVSLAPRRRDEIEPPDSPQPPPEPSNLGSLMWAAISELPYRMRAALLLTVDEEVAFLLGGGKEPDLTLVLPDWNPPPELKVSDLPFLDGVVAHSLGITKENLHTSRSRAREIVRRRLSAWGDWPPEVSA